MMKKIQLRKTDGPISMTDFLPELEEEDDDIQHLEAERVEKPVQGDEVSFLQSKTQEELNDHIKKCLEMSTENKINQKNAFALQLIDCMSILMQNEDFSTMACTLDAGAKIYSCRVDALHQQVVKLAEEVIQHLRQKKRDKDSREDDDEEDKLPQGHKKRGIKKTTIASRETLNRKLKGKDPRDKYIKMEAMPGMILSGVRRDAKDLSFSLELSVPFWQNWERYEPLKAKKSVTLPEIKIVRDNPLSGSTPCSIDSALDFIENIPMKTEGPADYSEVSLSPILPLAECEECDSGDFKYPEDDQPEDFGRTTPDDEEVEVISTAMHRLKAESEDVGSVNNAPSRLEAMKMLFEGVGEYDYLNKKNANYWAGPDFWKRPKNPVGNVTEKRNVKRKKRVPGEIVYDFGGLDEKWNQMFKRGFNLRGKTVQGWKNSKNTMPTDLKVDVAMFVNLFHMAVSRKHDNEKTCDEHTVFINVLENSIDNADISDSLREPSQETVNTPDSHNSLNDSFYQGGPSIGDLGSSGNRDTLNSAFYDIGMVQTQERHSIADEDAGKIIRVEIASDSSKTYGETTLVPVPKMVNFKPLKYSTKPIRVDMQHLKANMMDIIEEEIDRDDMQKETKFSEVLKNLPGRLERRTAEDTSPAIAFMALLTLANEHNLQLENTENYRDVVVKLEAPVTEDMEDVC